MPNLPLVSVIFITYKRLDLLRKTYDSFCKVCKYPNLELILCDDGSPIKTQEEMTKIYFNKYLFSDKNRGLANNQNKGIVAANGEYILHLQDDWLCHGPGDFIEAALDVFDASPEIGIIRFWSFPEFTVPYDVCETKNGNKFRLYRANANHLRSRHDYVYSDRPHIKRKSFHVAIGHYREDLYMNDMEIEFCERLSQHPEIRGAQIEHYDDIFEHIGAEKTFNPSQKRANLRTKMERHWFMRYPWKIYLYLRYGKRSLSNEKS
jgi:glycosyltransferase involved in cell wall biosynthesis